MDAEALVGKEQAKRRVAVTQEALDEKMDNIRGAVTMGKEGQEHNKGRREREEHSYVSGLSGGVQYGTKSQMTQLT